MAVLVQELNELLDQWLRWYRFRRAVLWALRGLALGLAVALILSLVALPRGLLLQEEYLLLVLVIASAGLALFAGAAYIWPLARQRAAQYFDLRFGLKERVSTALELATGDHIASEDLRQRQLIDAVAVARTANPRKGLPLRAPRVETLLVLLLLASAGLLWLRSGDYYEAALQNRLVEQAINQEAQQVEEILAQIEQIQTLSPEQRQALSEPLQEALRQLHQAQSLEEAISILNNAEAQMESTLSSQAQEQLQELRTAGEALQKAEGSPLQEFGQDLAEGDLSSASQSLQDIRPQDLSQAESEALSAQLEEAVSGLSQGNSDLAAELRSAAENMRNGAPGAAQERLEQASEILAGAAHQELQTQVSEQAASQLRQSGQRLLQAANDGQNLADSADTGQGQGTVEQQGAGQGQAEGQGQGQQNGQEGGGGAGRGEGSQSTTQGGEAGTDPIQQGNGPGDGGIRPYEQIYAPGRLGSEGGEDVSLPGSGQPGDQVLGQVETPPGEMGRSTVPYVEALPAYQEAYRRAIESGQVPLHLRSLIRDYFSSLEP